MVSGCISDAKKERLRKTLEARQLDVGADRLQREVKLRENAQREAQGVENSPEREAAAAEAAARNSEEAQTRAAEQAKREAERERELQEAPARAAAEAANRRKAADDAAQRRSAEAKRASKRAESAARQRAEIDRKAAEHAKRRAEAQAAAAAKAAEANPARRHVGAQVVDAARAVGAIRRTALRPRSDPSEEDSVMSSRFFRIAAIVASLGGAGFALGALAQTAPLKIVARYDLSITVDANRDSEAATRVKAAKGAMSLFGGSVSAGTIEDVVSLSDTAYSVTSSGKANRILAAVLGGDTLSRRSEGAVGGGYLASQKFSETRGSKTRLAVNTDYSKRISTYFKNGKETKVEAVNYRIADTASMPYLFLRQPLPLTSMTIAATDGNSTRQIYMKPVGRGGADRQGPGRRGASRRASRGRATMPRSTSGCAKKTACRCASGSGSTTSTAWCSIRNCASCRRSSGDGSALQAHRQPGIRPRYPGWRGIRRNCRGNRRSCRPA